MKFVRTLLRNNVNVAGAIYGTVLVLGIIGSASEDELLSLWADVVIVLSTMAVFWVAHVYAALIARGASEDVDLSWRDARHVARHEWPLLQAAVAPSVPLVLGALGILGRGVAVSLSFVVGIAVLFGWGLAISRLRHASRGRTLATSMISTGLGVAVAALHAAFAH